jgi:hypothetical protein
MRCAMPNFPFEFEIPDDWLTEADVVGFKPTTAACRSTSNAMSVPLVAVESPYRVLTVVKDWCGFDRSRFISVFKGIVTATEIEPVPLLQLPLFEFAQLPAVFAFAMASIASTHRSSPDLNAFPQLSFESFNANPQAGPEPKISMRKLWRRFAGLVSI